MREIPVILAVLFLAAGTAEADWLDVVATSADVRNMRTGEQGSTIEAQEGDPIEIICQEWIGLADDKQFWHTDVVQRWENRILVDGTSIAIFNPTLPPGTKIGNYVDKGGLFESSKSVQGNPTEIRRSYGPRQWVASGAGNHEISCVVNQPKGISDHNAANNVVRALVRVFPATPEAAAGTASDPESRDAAAAVSPATAIDTVRVPTADIRSMEASAQVSQPKDSPQTLTVASGRKALTANVAPPNPCALDVVYYKPGLPMAEASASVPAAGDTVLIRCEFYRTTGRIEFPQCNERAQKAIERLRFAQSSSSRYSGMLQVDGNSVRVISSPHDGSDFSLEQQWIYREAGQHEIACAVDNGLRPVDNDAMQQLARSALHTVGVAPPKRRYTPPVDGPKQRVTLSPQPSVAPLPADSPAKLSEKTR